MQKRARAHTHSEIYTCRPRGRPRVAQWVPGAAPRGPVLQPKHPGADHPARFPHHSRRHGASGLPKKVAPDVFHGDRGRLGRGRGRAALGRLGARAQRGRVVLPGAAGRGVPAEGNARDGRALDAAEESDGGDLLREGLKVGERVGREGGVQRGCRRGGRDPLWPCGKTEWNGIRMERTESGRNGTERNGIRTEQNGIRTGKEVNRRVGGKTGVQRRPLGRRSGRLLRTKQNGLRSDVETGTCYGPRVYRTRRQNGSNFAACSSMCSGFTASSQVN